MEQSGTSPWDWIFGPRNSIEHWFRTVKERVGIISGVGTGEEFTGLFSCLLSGIILLGFTLGLVDHLVMLLNGFRR